MHRKQINVRVPSEILEKIDQKGKRSEVVRKAIERYLSEGDVYQMVDKTIDKKIDDMIEGQIDLGELAVQHLILAIPPYPKKEGAAYQYSDEAIKPAEDSPLKKNPFEALKDWKEKR